MRLSGKIVLHLCFWILVEAIWNNSCSVSGSSLLRGQLEPGELEWVILMYTIHIVSFYSFYFIYKLENGFTLQILGLYLGNYILICALRYYGLGYFYAVLGEPDYFAHIRFFWSALLRTLMFGTYATLIALIESRFTFAKLEKELNEQNAKSEMALLRSQINPHFLYNTLNNIYSLAYPKSTKAAQAVMKLSGIMRYSLTEANNKFVPLQKEIDYLHSYISLERMRYRNPSFIEFSVEGDMDNINIAPMLFIPFVENAFKHGDIEKGGSTIKINLRADMNSLVFEVVNRYNADSQQSQGSGIGLRNVRRRLELIYPNRHKLTVDDNKSGSTFNVRLEIYF
ncbi:sensor histidine kinase [Ulvibacterium sp.]|uniref:sensor histidine kinase n=1 Tax=Ulvibacterium sp. TaxID=2665914 RepID=UPI003BAA2A31